MLKIWGMVTIWDKLVVISLISISILGMILIPIFNSGTNNKYVEIKVNNEIIEKIYIKDNMQNTYSFKFGENTGYIEVKNGSVRMQEMDLINCPKKICSDTGWIRENYEIIVCLPNKIVVSIKENYSGDVDILLN